MIGPLVASAVAALYSLAGQDLPVRVLGTPLAPSIGPFVEVAGVRELSGERVIVLDKLDRSLHLVNLRSGGARRLGRDGDGPGEYRLPLKILALPGDTTLVYDMGNSGRFVVYGPDGKPARPIPIEYRGNSGAPTAADSLGRLYVAERGVRGLAETYLGKIVRIDRGSGRRDSIATVSFRAVTQVALLPRPGPPPPFTTIEQWAVAWDGRVAVVHVEPYSVTLHHPDGSTIAGPAIPEDRIRVSSAHKEEWLAEWKRPVPAIVNGEYTVRPRSEPDLRWPETLPPFLPDAIAFASDGMLWIRRTTAARAPAEFDLVDGHGKVATKVRLPPRTRLVGFGSRTVYLVRVDNDDLEYLERYRLP
ncbi:MAG TPA: hypothetical protein VI383_03065 [Gemmatimonadales bacterium]|nr:hypothetical protein [Gemmatimonadales bacterium]